MSDRAALDDLRPPDSRASQMARQESWVLRDARRSLNAGLDSQALEGLDSALGDLGSTWRAFSRGWDAAKLVQEFAPTREGRARLALYRWARDRLSKTIAIREHLEDDRYPERTAGDVSMIRGNLRNVAERLAGCLFEHGSDEEATAVLNDVVDPLGTTWQAFSLRWHFARMVHRRCGREGLEARTRLYRWVLGQLVRAVAILEELPEEEAERDPVADLCKVRGDMGPVSRHLARAVAEKAFQLKSQLGDRFDLEAALTEAGAILDEGLIQALWVIEKGSDPLRVARGYIERAHTFKESFRLGLAPHDSMTELRLHDLEEAEKQVRSLLWPHGIPPGHKYQHYEWSVLSERLEQMTPQLREAVTMLLLHLLVNLAGTYCVAGRNGVAGWLLTFAGQLADGSDKPAESVRIALDRGRLERDRNLELATNRLELALSFDPSEIDTRNPFSLRRWLADKMLTLAHTLDARGLRASAEYWAHEGHRLVAEDKSSQADRVRQRARARMAWKPAAAVDDTFADSEGDVLPSDDIESFAGDTLSLEEGDSTPASIAEAAVWAVDSEHEQIPGAAGRLRNAVLQEKTLGVAIVLFNLSQTMFGSRQVERLEGWEHIPEQVAAAASWGPATGRRTNRVTRPDPGDWATNRLEAAIYVGELALEFADNYCPGMTPKILFHLGSCESSSSDASAALRARERWLEAQESAKRMHDWQMTAKCHMRLAHSYSSGAAPGPGELKQVRWHARQALREVGWGLKLLEHGYDRFDALRDYADTIALIAKVMAETNAPARDVFEALELASGEAVLWARTGVPRGSPANVDPALTEFQLLLEERQVQKKYGEARLHNDYAGEELEAVRRRGKKELDELHRKLLGVRAGRIRESLRATSASFAPNRLHSAPLPRSSSAESRFKANDLMDAVGKSGLGSTAIVRYAASRGSIICSALRRDGADSSEWTGVVATRAAIKGLPAHVWSDLALDSIEDDLSRRGLRKMYDLLLSPLEENGFLSGLENIYFVPQDEIASLPLHAALRESEFLAERVCVGYAPSARVLQRLMRVNTYRGRGFLGVGWDSQIAAPQEIASAARTIRARVPRDRITCPLGEGFGVPYLLTRGKWTVIHVAAHGVYSPLASMASEIRFGRHSISAARWMLEGPAAQLVLVNACDLGTQTSRAGDLYGFPFALIASQSLSAIVASRPIYPGHASEFSGRLFEALVQDGQTKLGAFSETTRALIAQDKWRSPNRWASYFFIGDPRPMVW